ncbi:MAG: four helix bundle protein [Chloroflexi bacterium]|nr:MAG: four helix bundle protein [Chloroflexota bacterium]
MAERGQREFEDSECYQLALQVLKEAYRVAGRLPPEERHNLAHQMRKAAVSVVLNIAEGYGRYHYLDSLRFYYTARGSLDETLSGFVICDEVEYTSGELPRQRELCHSALRSLNGYIRYVRRRQQGHQEYGNHILREEGPIYIIAPELPEE